MSFVKLKCIKEAGKLTIYELVDYACKYGSDPEKIKEICNYLDNYKYNIKKTSSHLLSYCINYCLSKEFLFKLIDKGISLDKNFSDELGYPPPIIMALYLGKNDIIMKLIDSNVNLDINFKNKVPLLEALQNRYISDNVILKMIEKKAHINCKEGWISNSSIVAYAFLGNRSIEIYNKLLDGEFIHNTDYNSISKVMSGLLYCYVNKRL